MKAIPFEILLLHLFPNPPSWFAQQAGPSKVCRLPIVKAPGIILRGLISVIQKKLLKGRRVQIKGTCCIIIEEGICVACIRERGKEEPLRFWGLIVDGRAFFPIRLMT